MQTEFKTITQPLHVVCSFMEENPEHITIQYQVKNISAVTLHLFNSPRMPYILLQEDDSLLVLHGIHPPDPDMDYYGIEIPITQPLQPGEVVEHQVSLMPLYLKNHYEVQRLPLELHGKVTVHCHVGWGETAIPTSERHRLSINTLLAWQHIVQAEPIQVVFP